MSELRPEHSAELEALVDTYGLRYVLAELASICAGKAQHIRETWQDEPLARAWDKAGGRVTSAANTRAVIELP